MYIADALSARHWAEIVELGSIVDVDISFELEKENIWHRIKRACIRGQYNVTYLSEFTGEKAERLAIVFKGYGYNVDVTKSGLFEISWKESNNE